MTTFKSEQKDYYQKDFKGLKISGRKIDSIIFEECSFKNSDFSEAIFRKCNFIDCHFSQCNLSVTKMDYCKFNDVIFEHCKAIGIDWTQIDWPNVASFSPIKFFKCIINDSTFLRLNLNKIVIEDCEAHNVDFRGGSFCNSNFAFTDFANSLFKDTNLSGADFTKAINYQIDINCNQINKAKFSKYEAISLLENSGIELID